MPSFPLPRLSLGLVLAATVLCGLPARLAAELVWKPQTGWRVEGGVLAGVAGGPEARNALELMNKARNDEERHHVGAAISGYNKVGKKYPNSIYAPEALYRAAKLYLGRKEYYNSFSAFQSVVGRYPSTRRFNEIIGEQYRIAGSLLNGARNHFWGVFPGLTSRTRGVEYFEYVLRNAPYSDYAPLCVMNIARGFQQMNETEAAIDALDRFINPYPQSLLTADAYLKLAQTHASLVDGPYYDQGSTKEALTYYEDFMILFPNDANIAAAARGLDAMKKMLAESKMKMADFYFYKRDNYTAAKVFYNEAITAYPDSEVARRAKGMLVAVAAKAAGRPVPAPAPGQGTAPKKKRFWLF